MLSVYIPLMFSPTANTTNRVLLLLRVMIIVTVVMYYVLAKVLFMPLNKPIRVIKY
ncbi:hypothetical protein D3C81_2268070 [compost metagenome]